MSKSRIGFSSRYKRQQGAVAIMAAVLMVAAVMFLAVVADTGRLYYQKRDLQKNADLAAMEVALRYCRDQKLDVESLAIPAGDGEYLPGEIWSLMPSLGNFNGDLTNLSPATPATRNENAVTVTLRLDTPKSLFGQLISSDDSEFALEASATAKACEPAAQLAIRSNIATVEDGVLLGLLGEGGVGIGWESLLNVNLNLLSYLERAADVLNVDITAGNYNEVLSANITLVEILDIALSTLPSGADADLAEIAIQDLRASIPGGLPTLHLGNIISVAEGTPEASLDVLINAFSLVRGGIQLANDRNAATIDLPVVGIPGLANVEAQVSVIEPQQVSAIGNPFSDDISVRTAQLRAFLSVDLSSTTSILTDLNNILAPLLDPVVSFLDSVTNENFSILNLIGAVGNLLTDVFELILTICDGNCPIRNASYIEAVSAPLNIYIDAGSAEAYTGPSTTANEAAVCDGETKELNVDVVSDLLNIGIGTIDVNEVFSSSSSPTIEPFPLAEIGYRKVRPARCFILLGLGSCEELQWEQEDGTYLTGAKTTAEKYVLAGIALTVDSSLVGSGSEGFPVLLGPPSFNNPNLPEIGEEPEYKSIPENRNYGDIDIDIEVYSRDENGLLGDLLIGNDSLLSGLVNDLLDLLVSENGVIANLLNNLIFSSDNDNPSLLSQLGITLAGGDVGATMTCENDSVRLVQ